MILVEAGDLSAEAFGAKVLFAAQLHRQGYKAVIDDRTIPEEAPRNLKYEASRFLVDVSALELSDVLLIGGHRLADEMLTHLRTLRFSGSARLSCVGFFPDRQTLIQTRSKMAFATGCEPQVVNLLDSQRSPLVHDAYSPQLALPLESADVPSGPVRLCVFVDGTLMQAQEVVGALEMLALDPVLRLSVIVYGPAPEAPVPAVHSHYSIYRLEDISVEAMLRQYDVAVVAGDGPIEERLAVALVDLMGSGKPTVDCTTDHILVASGSPALRGPESLAALPNYLKGTVLLNRTVIGGFMHQSSWLKRSSFEQIEKSLGLVRPASAASTDRIPRTVLMPTNGVGLGHAQRLGLIASSMATRDSVIFAAFPSCVPLLRNKGFSCIPLVQKSPEHAESYANDLVNYVRLDRALQRGDRFVFDGGYIFDSLLRLILEKDISAVWLRRGLWQPGQANLRTLARGRIFRKIIVPQEAFDELNDGIFWDRSVENVGPVVQTATQDAGSIRARLAEKLDRPFEKLVVSMLGGGSAADRSAQLQTLCNLLERRDDCLHLVIVWPGSRVEPGLYGWKNSRVIQTQNALAFAKDADLVISACGYNSFHEVLYHRLPAIFMPQMAPFMDDQERRARAASERQLAETVMSHELFRLDREVRAFLDEGKADAMRRGLAATRLPATGTERAAKLIDEVVQQ